MVQDISSQSWGSRIVNSFFGIIIGIVLIIGSFVLIFWNEGNALHTAQSLAQAQKVLVEVPNSPVNPDNNKKVIYFTGDATTEDVLTDPIFNISEKAIKLHRDVKMYQWKQDEESKTEKEFGGSEKTVKTYSYRKVWDSDVIDSSAFKESGHDNPASMPIKTQHYTADNVTVGDFTLSSELIDKIEGFTDIDLSKIDTSALEEKYSKKVSTDDDRIFLGKDPQFPEIGDLQITLTVSLPQTVSIIGQQTEKTIQAYKAPAGRDVLLLEMGDKSSIQMFINAQNENSLLAWILRAVSLGMMVFGIFLLMGPIAVLADVIPFVGSLVRVGTGLIAFVLGLILWASATAIAWITVRPILAIGFIIVVVGIAYLLIKRKRAKLQTH